MRATPGSIFQKVIRRLRRYKNRAVAVRRRLLRRPRIFEDGYSIDDHTLVTLYTDRDDLFPDYLPRIRPSDVVKKHSISVTLIAAAKNEAANAREWVLKILDQTRLPNEIVVVDTGSTDGTLPLLQQLAAASPVPFRVIEAPGCNISQGRNLAIRTAQFAHIAVTDFGTQPHSGWLERLIFPFEHNPEMEVSGGWYDAVGGDRRPYRWRKWISLLGKNPQEILSPSVSIAFTKAAWERAGRYPEWLTMTGEDTYFDLELKRTSRWWAFSPEALVDWEAPDSVWAYWKKMYRWSTGDGETGMRAAAYWYATVVSALTLAGVSGGLLLLIAGGLLRLPIVLMAGIVVLLVVLLRAAKTGRAAGYSAAEVVLVMGILAAQALGFIRGASRREKVTQRRLQNAKRIFFILAGIPIDDTGGGARSTQISLELLRRQSIICYINKYPKAESVDLNLSIRHPNLFTSPADRFSLQKFCDQYNLDLSAYQLGAVVELPHPDWLPLIEELQENGARIIYELIDEWDSNLGEGWYSQAAELATAQRAVALTATAPILKTRLETFAGQPVSLLPNAVNLRLFDRRKDYAVPTDLDGSGMVITYIGALYGNWFDWELLVNTARAFSQAHVVVIGDYQGQCPAVLPNLHFLGLKPQADLPAYLAHTSVAIIPWKVNDITLATSPLKLYEYLAMHVPVVAPDLPPMRNIPGVYLSADHEAFLRNIRIAAHTPIDASAVDQFLSQNSWETRVDRLIYLMQHGSPVDIQTEREQQAEA